jgi:hypothetical protein
MLPRTDFSVPFGGKGSDQGSVLEIDPGVTVLAQLRRSLLWRTQFECS